MRLTVALLVGFGLVVELVHYRHLPAWPAVLTSAAALSAAEVGSRYLRARKARRQA